MTHRPTALPRFFESHPIRDQFSAPPVPPRPWFISLRANPVPGSNPARPCTPSRQTRSLAAVSGGWYTHRVAGAAVGPASGPTGFETECHSAVNRAFPLPGMDRCCRFGGAAPASTFRAARHIPASRPVVECWSCRRGLREEDLRRVELHVFPGRANRGPRGPRGAAAAFGSSTVSVCASPGVRVGWSPPT